MSVNTDNTDDDIGSYLIQVTQTAKENKTNMQIQTSPEHGSRETNPLLENSRQIRREHDVVIERSAEEIQRERDFQVIQVPNNSKAVSTK